MVIYASREAMRGLTLAFMGSRVQSRIRVSQELLNWAYTANLMATNKERALEIRHYFRGTEAAAALA